MKTKTPLWAGCWGKVSGLCGNPRLNGGVLAPFEFESSTLTIVVQQIIALKTIESKFYVATPCAALISALGMASIIMMKAPYQPWVRIPVWDSLETFHS